MYRILQQPIEVFYSRIHTFTLQGIFCGSGVIALNIQGDLNLICKLEDTIYY